MCLCYYFYCSYFSLLSLSLLATVFYFRFFSSWSAPPTHAHSLNEILHVHVMCQHSFDPVNTILSVLLICTTKKRKCMFACMCGGGFVYFITPGCSISPNAISLMWEEQTGWSSFSTLFLVFNKRFFRTARLLAHVSFFPCHSLIFIPTGCTQTHMHVHTLCSVIHSRLFVEHSGSASCAWLKCITLHVPWVFLCIPA